MSVTKIPNAVFGVFKSTADTFYVQNHLEKYGFILQEMSVKYPSRNMKKDLFNFQETSIQYFGSVGAVIGVLVFMGFGILAAFEIVPLSSFPQHLSLTQEMVLLFVGLLGCIALGIAGGAVVGIGTPLKAHLRYSNSLEKGAILMSVQIQNAQEDQLVSDVFKSTGAKEIHTLPEEDGWRNVRKKLKTNLNRRMKMSEHSI